MREKFSDEENYYADELENYSKILDKILAIEKGINDERIENKNFYIKIIEDFIPIYDNFILLYNEKKNTNVDIHLNSYAEYLFNAGKPFLKYHRDFKLKKLL